MQLSDKEASLWVQYLALEAIQQAQSGHPGAVLGLADTATVLWRHWLRLRPSEPTWADRDHCVLSNGHASALLYALLHLRSYPIHRSDLKAFRQLGSHTPGHPEHDPIRGIEVTTGPLGQGFGAAVGLALAQARRQSNSPSRTYVFVGDGCLMEGISHEVANIASHQGLDTLIAVWDDNQITIDGSVSSVSREDTCARFASYGWEVIGPVDGHDPKAIHEAFEAAQKKNGRPKFIDVRTVLGKGILGAEGTPKLHGSPLSQEQWAQWKEAHASELASLLERDDYSSVWSEPCPDTSHNLSQPPQKMPSVCPKRPSAEASLSTRAASQRWLRAACAVNTDLFGGSADLDASVLTYPGAESLSPYMHYGVREFGMCAVANGLALGGYRPYVGTFLVFSDYAKNAIRLSAMMRLPVVYVFTHDSIALGEDGPTHQPVEQLTGLRSIPHIDVWRPADAYETYACWEEALKRTSGPSVLVLSRQNVPSVSPMDLDISSGVQCLVSVPEPTLIIIATGSEVALAVQAAQHVTAPVCVLSCPNLNRFRGSALHDHYRAQAPFFVIEAASSWCWGDIQSDPRYRLTLDDFGASGKGPELMEHFGFDLASVVLRLKAIGIE